MSCKGLTWMTFSVTMYHPDLISFVPKYTKNVLFKTWQGGTGIPTQTLSSYGSLVTEPVRLLELMFGYLLCLWKLGFVSHFP